MLKHINMNICTVLYIHVQMLPIVRSIKMYSNFLIIQYIIAVTSGRGEARGEVGIAAIDIHHSHLILCQMSDYQTYINTLTKIYIFNPVEVSLIIVSKV